MFWPSSGSNNRQPRLRKNAAVVERAGLPLRRAADQITEEVPVDQRFDLTRVRTMVRNPIQSVLLVGAQTYEGR